MKKGTTLEVACPRCKGLHQVPLDAAGRYTGPPPCAPESNERWNVQVDPAQWREFQNSEAQRRVH